jgi:hypothetical protein
LFERAGASLITELSPVGRFEEAIVADLARLMWRKQNLNTLRRPPNPQNGPPEWVLQIVGRPDPSELEPYIGADAAAKMRREDEAKAKAKEEEIRRYNAIKKANIAAELAKAEIPTIDQFMTLLTVEERLDALIDRCVKRLFFVRGLKSISSASSWAPPKAVRSK